MLANGSQLGDSYDPGVLGCFAQFWGQISQAGVAELADAQAVTSAAPAPKLRMGNILGLRCADTRKARCTSERGAYSRRSSALESQ